MNGEEALRWRAEWRPLALLAALFIALYFLPLSNPRFTQGLVQGIHLAKWYAREHVLLCLVPAFFIAGAISVFISDAAVMRYLGRNANKVLAYGVAAVSGSLLAVCSCTVLPLFAGIHRRGAGLGPATAFLYSGPAINVLAITLTASVLGWQMGLARALGAVLFAVVIGLAMAFIFRREGATAGEEMKLPPPTTARPLWKSALFFAILTAILVFATWGRPENTDGVAFLIFRAKWWLTAAAALALSLVLVEWLELERWRVGAGALATVIAALVLPRHPQVAFAVGAVALSLLLAGGGGEARGWLDESWGFAKQILPLLFIGVLVAGFFLGRPGHEGVVPAAWVASAVGGNSLVANLFASVAGALMYFATLTEVPIVQGLMANGMGQGPALALLLAGPALSLPNMLVIASVMGWKKTSVYVALVVIMATLSG
ncbi:MAG TPA: permease, partial [Thermoanaerobaculia bacterium]|nr:permease [Thermoanaerobaculia bacterium]